MSQFPAAACVGVEVLSNKVMKRAVGRETEVTLPEIIILCGCMSVYHEWLSVHKDHTAIKSTLSVRPLALESGLISEKVRVIIIPIRESLHNMAFSSADEKGEQRTNSRKLF